jgi:putative MATE family efflux protein
MEPNNENVLNDDRVGRLLLRLSLPAFIGMFVMTLYNVVDTIFIGHFVGPLGIAALAIVFPVQMLAMGIGHMTGMGGASLISRLIGARDKQRAERSLGNAVTLTIVLSGIIMGVGLYWLDECLSQLGASETILPYAREYMRIILVGLFFQTFAMLLNTLIRAEGNARIPMVGMIIGAILNTALDAIFIIVLDMGIRGAALATVIGESVSVVFFIIYYLSGKNYLRFLFKNMILEWKTTRLILSIGMAAFGMSVATSLSAIFINRICLVYGGDLAVSAFGIINRIIMFALMPGIVIGMGLQPIVGFNYGARRFDRILKAIAISMITATIFCVVAFVLMRFFPEPFINVFSGDAELVNLASYGIRRLFFGVYLVGVVMVGSTIFLAIGKVVQSFITSIARATLFLIPSVFILPHYIQLDGVWWSFPLSDLLTFVLTTALLIPQLNQFWRERKYQLAGAAVLPDVASSHRGNSAA